MHKPPRIFFARKHTPLAPRTVDVVGNARRNLARHPEPFRATRWLVAGASLGSLSALALVILLSS